MSAALNQFIGWLIRKGDRKREDARRAEDLEREDKRRAEDNDLKFRMANSVMLSVAHLLEHFVQRSSDYFDAIEGGLATWRGSVDDSGLRSLNRSEFTFVRPVEIAWDLLPPQLVDNIKQIELGLARCHADISLLKRETWAEPDDIFEQESQRVMVYGLRAAEIVEQIRNELGLPLPEPLRHNRAAFQSSLNSLELDYVTSKRVISLIPELLDQFETTRTKLARGD